MIKGIYYEEKAFNIGTMSTAKKTGSDNILHYWLQEKEDGEINIYYIKPDGEPTSIVMETVKMDDFKKRFKDCSTHKCNFRKKSPEELEAEKVEEKVAMGKKHLEKEEFNAAKYEFGNALKTDEKHLKANLGKGKAHMALGETDQAKEHFKKMSENEELFDEEHMHTFNELGIELRRNGMYDEAIENYGKAVKISPKDEVLYYNMGRAYKEKGEKKSALQALRKALEIEPNFKEAADLMKTVE